MMRSAVLFLSCLALMPPADAADVFSETRRGQALADACRSCVSDDKDFSKNSFILWFWENVYMEYARVIPKNCKFVL